MRLAVSAVAAASLILVGCSDDDKGQSDVGVGAQLSAQSEADSKYNKKVKARIYNKMADMVRTVKLESNEDGSDKITLVGMSSVLGSGNCVFNVKQQNAWKKGNGNSDTKLSGSHKKCSDVLVKTQKSGEFTTVTFNNIYANGELKAFFRTLNMQLSNVTATEDADNSRAFSAALEGKKVQVQIGRVVWPSQIENKSRDSFVITGELNIEGQARPTDANENIVIDISSDNVAKVGHHIDIAGFQAFDKQAEVDSITIESPNANYFANSERLRGSRIQITSDRKAVSATAILR